MKGNADHDRAWAKQERRLESEGCLRVQRLLPPMRGHKLRQNYGNRRLGVLFVEIIDISHQRRNERSVRADNVLQANAVEERIALGVLPPGLCQCCDLLA